MGSWVYCIHVYLLFVNAWIKSIQFFLWQYSFSTVSALRQIKTIYIIKAYQHHNPGESLNRIEWHSLCFGKQPMLINTIQSRSDYDNSEA